MAFHPRKVNVGMMRGNLKGEFRDALGAARQGNAFPRGLAAFGIDLDPKVGLRPEPLRSGMSHSSDASSEAPTPRKSKTRIWLTFVVVPLLGLLLFKLWTYYKRPRKTDDGAETHAEQKERLVTEGLGKAPEGKDKEFKEFTGKLQEAVGVAMEAHKPPVADAAVSEAQEESPEPLKEESSEPPKVEKPRKPDLTKRAHVTSIEEVEDEEEPQRLSPPASSSPMPARKTLKEDTLPQQAEEESISDEEEDDSSIGEEAEDSAEEEEAEEAYDGDSTEEEEAEESLDGDSTEEEEEAEESLDEDSADDEEEAEESLAEDSAEMEEDAEEEEADLAEDESTDRNVGDEAQPDATEAAAVEVPTPAPEEVDLPQGEGAPQELDEGAEEVDKAPAKKKAATRSSKRIRKPKK